MASRVGLGLLLAIPFIVSNVEANSPLVRAAGGSIRGVVQPVEGVNVDRFLGVPYARPPVGELRFALPVPFGSVGELNATKESPMCPQRARMSPPIPQSEDCLYLDVHRKSGTVQGDDKPVIVIFHGGIFKAGANSDFLVHSVALAGLGDVVVVSLSYRLGILGFADMKDLAPGNLGLFDQRLALEWVQDNVRAFGGDPNRVTLMGVNAGAMSISLHIATPLNGEGRKLFHAAIMDGGVASRNTVVDADVSFARMKKIAEQLACPTSGIEMVACLRKADANELVKLSSDPEGYGALVTFHPTMDGKFVQKSIFQNLDDAKNYAKVKIILGYAKDEGTMLARYARKVGVPDVPAENLEPDFLEWCKKIAFHFKYPIDLNQEASTNNVLEMYHKMSPNSSVNAITFIGDGTFVCPVNAFIRRYSMSNAHVYVYRFERTFRQRYSYLDPDMLGVFHSSPFIHLSGCLLGIPLTDLNVTSVNAEDRSFFLDAIKMVAEFARSDDTPTFRDVVWPDFSQSEGVMVLDDKPRIVPDLHSEQRCKKVFP